MSAAPGAFEEVLTDLGTLTLPAEDPGLGELRARGTLWPEESLAMRRLVPPGATTVQVEAGFGYGTLLLSRLVGPRGKVLAYEADPSLRALLRRNLERAEATNVSLLEEAPDTAAEGLAEVGPPGAARTTVWLVEATANG